MYPFYRHGAPPERDGDGAGPGDFYHQPTGKEGEILSGFSIALLIQSFDPTRNDGRCPPYGSSIARDLQRESVRTESGQDAPPTVYLFVSSEKNGGTGCESYND